MADDDDLHLLVQRARHRDSDAWEAVYRRAYPRLIAYARRRVHSPDAAEDVVSETMARALGAIDRFTWKGAGFDAWLYGICRNVVLESVRSASRISADFLPEIQARERGPLETVVSADEAGEVRQAFATLSATDQEILELRVVGQLDARAVGDVLDMRSGAVRTAQSRAIGRLCHLLGGRI